MGLVLDLLAFLDSAVLGGVEEVEGRDGVWEQPENDGEWQFSQGDY